MKLKFSMRACRDANGRGAGKKSGNGGAEARDRKRMERMAKCRTEDGDCSMQSSSREITLRKGGHCDHGDVAARSPYAVTAALVAAANDDEAPPLREEPVARLPWFLPLTSWKSSASRIGSFDEASCCWGCAW